MWYSFAPTKVSLVSFARNLSIRNIIIAMAVDMEEVLIADMQHWPDVLQISFNHTVESKYLLNKKYLPLLVSLTDKLNVLGWTLSLSLTVQSRIWTSLSLLPSLAIRPWCLLPAQNQDLWPRERRRPNFDRYPHINLVPFILERSSLIICCEMPTNH